MTRPLPPEYVRPSLAEYLAASKTHTKDTYLPFVMGHEAELRKHYVAPEPEPVLVAGAPELELEPEAPAEPVHYFNPREAMAEAAAAAAKLEEPAEAYKRPTVEEWQAASYGRDLTGDELVAAHKKFFDDYEAELLAKQDAAESASGELSPSA